MRKIIGNWKQKLGVSAAIFLLNGCETPQQQLTRKQAQADQAAEFQRLRIERFTEHCMKYGFTRGSVPMSQCLMNLDQQEQNRYLDMQNQCHAAKRFWINGFCVQPF